MHTQPRPFRPLYGRGQRSALSLPQLFVNDIIPARPHHTLRSGEDMFILQASIQADLKACFLFLAAGFFDAVTSYEKKLSANQLRRQLHLD